jgi:hypothetical protein
MNRTTLVSRATRHLSLPQLLLLVLLTLGVAGMHTLGHGAGQEHGHPGSPGMSDHMPVAQVVPPADVTLAAAAPLGEPPTGHGPDLSVFTVCLAVLGAWGIVLLLRWAQARRGRLGRTSRLPAAAPDRGHGRAPPARLVGLRMAVVSVMRL